ASSAPESEAPVIHESPTAKKSAHRTHQSSPPTLPITERQSLLAQESDLLAQAVRLLRREHDAEGALVLLSRHDDQFPQGLLGVECLFVRVDALLALHKDQEALSLLDRVKFAAVAHHRRLLALRAELRARANRCAEAVADFTELLASSALEKD